MSPIKQNKTEKQKNVEQFETKQNKKIILTNLL